MEDLKSQLSQALFWDVDFKKLDIDKYWQSTIVRILEYGTWKQWQSARKYYGDKKIIEAVTSSKWLTEKAWHFCSAIFDIPKEKFRCYITRQSTPTPWY